MIWSYHFPPDIFNILFVILLTLCTKQAVHSDHLSKMPLMEVKRKHNDFRFIILHEMFLLSFFVILLTFCTKQAVHSDLQSKMPLTPARWRRLGPVWPRMVSGLTSQPSSLWTLPRRARHHSTSPSSKRRVSKCKSLRMALSTIHEEFHRKTGFNKALFNNFSL